MPDSANQAERGGRKGWARDLVKTPSRIHGEAIIAETEAASNRSLGQAVRPGPAHERSSCPQQASEKSRVLSLGRVCVKLPTHGLLGSQAYRKLEGAEAELQQAVSSACCS